jgi:hypothetical protein
VVDQKIRDTDYAKTISHQWCDAHGQGQAPLDLTEPRFETELTSADNVMAAETEYDYMHHDKATRPRGNGRGDGMTTFDEKCTSTETRRSSKRATMSHRLRSNHQRHTWRISATRG